MSSSWAWVSQLGASLLRRIPARSQMPMVFQGWVTATRPTKWNMTKPLLDPAPPAPRTEHEPSVYRFALVLGNGESGHAFAGLRSRCTLPSVLERDADNCVVLGGMRGPLLKLIRPGHRRH